MVSCKTIAAQLFILSLHVLLVDLTVDVKNQTGVNVSKNEVILIKNQWKL